MSDGYSINPEEIELTEAQKEVCQMITEGLTDTEIAQRLGVSRAATLNRFKSSLKKLGARELERRYPHLKVREKIDYQLRNNPQTVTIKPKRAIQDAKAKATRERRALDRTASPVQKKFLSGLEEISDPAEALFKLMQIAGQAGVPKALLDGLSNRIMQGITEVEQMPEEYTPEDLHKELLKKSRMVISHIDLATVGGAKLTDLSSMLKTLQEQIQLLEGRPTAILAVEDKENMNSIAMAIQTELARRAGRSTIDGSCEEVSEED